MAGPVSESPTTPSYRALLAVPTLGRILVAMQLSRIAQSMTGVAIVLFVLTDYHSPQLAGIVAFVWIMPGLLFSPIAGALLDRYGPVRLVILDYLVAVATLALIGSLATIHALPAALLVAIAAISSLTGPLSATGVRSLFPRIVPRPLWERVNAVDSNGYLVATITGPPLAAGLVTLLGGEAALLLIGIGFGVAAVVLVGVADPPRSSDPDRPVLAEAWDGLRYTLRNPTLRGLVLSISALNVAGGVLTIAIPLIVIERLGLPEAAVGLAFATQGITGIAAAALTGRLDSRGRERRLLIVPMFLMAPAYAILVGANSLAMVALALGLVGLFHGPMDVALFTLRQRRTDPAMVGRAFAVSMSLNATGSPIGAAVTGTLAAYSLSGAVGLAALACVVAGVLAIAFVPASDPLRTRPAPRPAGDAR